VLAGAGVLKGKRVTSYPAVAPDMVNAGAEWVDVGLFDALVDGNLVTAQAWPAHPAFLRKFIELLGAKIEI
jgi:protease I